MRQFQKTLEDLGSRVASAETTTSTWQTPPTPSEASDQVQHLQRLRDKMTTAGALLDDCNEQQGYAPNFAMYKNQLIIHCCCLSVSLQQITYLFLISA